jgi:general secretion pathway protein D
VLKTTQRILVGWIAVAMSISAGFANAGLPDGLAVALLGGAAVGQGGGPGSIFSGLGADRPATPRDPFAAQAASAAPGAEANVPTRLPPTDSAQPLAAAPQNLGFAAPQFTPNKARSDALLRAARLALAGGDVRRAREMLVQARREAINYAPTEDSPERVEAAIARFVEVGRLDRAMEENRKTYAKMLIEQAEALVQWGELDEANKLAALAADQRVTYGAYEQKPDDLLRRIAAARQQINPAGPRQIDPRSTAPDAVGPTLAARQQAIELMRQIRAALAVGQTRLAEPLCRQLEAMQIPDNAFPPGQDRPGLVFQDVHQAMAREAGGVVQATYNEQPNPRVDPLVYYPAQNQGGVTQVSGLDPIPSPSNQPASRGYVLFQQAEAALKAHERDRALELFRQASAYSSELDPTTAARLQDQLSLLSMPRSAPPRASAAGQPISPVDAAQQTLLKQVYADVNYAEAESKRMLEKDPKGALAMLQETRSKVESAGLDAATRDQLLRRLDQTISYTQHFIELNHGQIELKEKNGNTRDELIRENNAKLQTQQKLAGLVDQFNRLVEEQRFEEAQVIAKQASELAPHEVVAQMMVSKISVIIKLDRERRIRDTTAENMSNHLIGISADADPGTGEPYIFPDPRHWRNITDVRQRRNMELNRRHRSEKEMEIEKKLTTPVNYSCHNRPLSEVLNQLAKLVDVNIHLDEEGLRMEGLSPDAPVTLELTSDIMLKSCLDLILEKNHLCYLIKNEVLNITSESKKGDLVVTVVYPVGDLVVPIPNFVASPRMGLAGAWHDAMNNAVGGGSGFNSPTSPMAVAQASRTGQPSNAMINPAVLANMMAPRAGTGPAAGGPGGAGGGTNADFDGLIDLITATVAPATWDHSGGKGNIAASPANLSLVVSQTQEVHEQIVDLLEQLRRMQDLQVTIEVRFITLSDNFFERIGVDFDFNIAQNIANPTAAGFTAPQNLAVGGQNYVSPLYAPNSTGTSIAGLTQAGASPAASGIFTPNLSIPFQQGSYALAVPQFGGFDAGAGATVGFAILSDIEAYFFINAAQGDTRTNILQAPKVTLFNGQQAFVSDTAQTPFVMGAVPVVGEFAAAEQPVIVVLSEGTFMTVQAVVSNDRRFVRLTIVPFFSKIGNVQTFTFSGTDTTTTNTTRNGIVNAATNLFNANNDQNTTTHSGVTVQLPTFAFTTVTTTVSVPDGGTVLLGGIKRLSEGRTEDGVPILDKIPYLDRLFKNVGIGRETSSLMMMVTPRIIIQEEEEDKMGVGTPP